MPCPVNDKIISSFCRGDDFIDPLLLVLAELALELGFRLLSPSSPILDPTEFLSSDGDNFLQPIPVFTQFGFLSRRLVLSL